MGRRKGFKMNKDPFGDLPEEFKDAVAGSNVDDVKKRIAEVAMNQVALMEAKKLDGDLAEAHQRYNDASALYRDGTKANKLKLQYCKSVLDSRGVVTGQ